MIFHLSYEIVPRPPLSFNPESKLLNTTEFEIIKAQIRKNAAIIDGYIEKIHLFVNQEKYPRRELFVEKIRRKMFLLMEENDTFRRVLWDHYQAAAALQAS
ncbi:MAG TPA: hypothetical protein PKL97_03245 [Candidatus Omnitrophota bacterium]|nr:hypothetical protein [Candidatus Omnitrophota bacterium]